MIKFQINPKYNHLKEEILALPQRFENEGEVIYAWRNLIKVLTIKGLKINVKSFKVPHIINRFAYRYIRKSKAERSYLNALKMLKIGIGTPDPIAYIIYQTPKGITKSYYISIQQECDYVLRELLEQQPKDFNILFSNYVDFVYSFHQKGLYFLDLSTGNTLLNREEKGKANFFLVDLNRAKFHSYPLNPYKGIQAFCRLDTTEENIRFIIHRYAEISGTPEKLLANAYYKSKQHDTNRRKRKALKNKILHKKKS